MAAELTKQNSGLVDDLTWQPGWLWPAGLTLQVWFPVKGSPSGWIFAEYLGPDPEDARYHRFYYPPEKLTLRAHTHIIRPVDCWPS